MPHLDWRVFIGMCSLLVAQFCSADGNKIKIAGTQNQSPLIHYVEDALELAYQGIDYQVEFVTVPLGRSFVEADQGRVDGLKARVSSVAKRYPILERFPFPCFSLKSL